MREEWRSCPGLQGIYEVSSLGNVRRTVFDRRTKRGRNLSPATNRKGYHHVCLSMPDGMKTKWIHRLVCEAFHGPPPTPKHQAAHRDDIKGNNTPDNIYWATGLQNHADRRRNGLILNGSQIGRAKLKEADIPQIRAMREAGALHREIGERFGVAPHTICRVLNGTRWGHMAA